MKLNQHSSVVPWRNPQEFREVYENFYSDDIIKMQQAVEIITVWETRCFPTLPTAIDASLVLKRAVIEDILHESSHQSGQEYNVRMLYSAAVIRFVNLIVENKQKYGSKLPMAILAEDINIPSWLVDVRHECAHGNLSSLAVLRMAAEEALRFLNAYFWQKELRNIRAFVKSSPASNEERILSLLKNYRKIHLELFDDPDYRKKKSLNRNLLGDLSAMDKCIIQSRRQFLDILLRPGVFICIDDITDLIQHNDLIFLESEDLFRIPEVLERMWYSMLRLLHRHDLLPEFLEMLLQTKQKTKGCQKMVAAWGLSLVTATDHDYWPIGKLFKAKNVLFNYKRLLYSCLMTENSYYPKLIFEILGQMKNSKCYRNLLDMLLIYYGNGIDSKRIPQNLIHDHIHQAENIENDLIFEEMENEKLTNESVWFMAPLDLDLSNLPIGAVLNPATAEDTEIDKKEQKVEENMFIQNESCQQVEDEDIHIPIMDDYSDEQINYEELDLIYGCEYMMEN